MTVVSLPSDERWSVQVLREAVVAVEPAECGCCCEIVLQESDRDPTTDPAAPRGSGPHGARVRVRMLAEAARARLG